MTVSKKPPASINFFFRFFEVYAIAISFYAHPSIEVKLQVALAQSRIRLSRRLASVPIPAASRPVGFRTRL